MRIPIEFASPDDAKPTLPEGKTRYDDSLLMPEFSRFKMLFGTGDTWLRIVPPIKGSAYPWHIIARTHNYEGGRHTHPGTLDKRDSVFDRAYAWIKANMPKALFSKANKDGIRLLTDPVVVFWMLTDIAGKPVPRLFVASGYDGSRGGVPGLGHQIVRAVAAATVPGTQGPVDPDGGVMICVAKTAPAGGRFPSYSVRLGNDPVPIRPILDRMDQGEFDRLRPLEQTIRLLDPEDEWQRLERTGLAPDAIARIRGSMPLASA